MASSQATPDDAVPEQENETEDAEESHRAKRLKIRHEYSPVSVEKLKLVGESSSAASAWLYRLKDEKRRSFAGHLAGALPKELADSFFQTINVETPWKKGSRSSTAWMVRPPCSCKYVYSHLGDIPLSMPGVEASVWPSWMDRILEHVMPLCGVFSADEWPDSCNVNYYENGWEGVGWHADDEALFQGAYQDCLIVSLSLGQPRMFSLCPDAAWDDGWVGKTPPAGWSTDDSYDAIDFELGHGDLCTMEGLVQRYYMHAALQSYDEDLKPRINLTWRWIVKHGDACAKRAGTK